MKSRCSSVTARLASFVLLMAVEREIVFAQVTQGSGTFLWKPPWRERGDCGPAALFVLLKLEDRDVTLREVKQHVSIDAVHGCSLASLAEASEKFGFPVEVRYVNPADITKVPRPFILHGILEKKANIGHFVVVVDYDERTRNLTLIDPIRERLSVNPLDSLLIGYSGYVLVPKENTEQRWSRLTGAVVFLGGSILLLGACTTLVSMLRNRGRRTGNSSQDVPINALRG